MPRHFIKIILSSLKMLDESIFLILFIAKLQNRAYASFLFQKKSKLSRSPVECVKWYRPGSSLTDIERLPGRNNFSLFSESII